MNRFRITQWYLVAALVIIGATVGWNQLSAAQAETDRQNGTEVLTRGPVHEAFAETVTFDPTPGIVVPKTPPNPIEEVAPDQRPEGANVAWIPGYWGWDDERNDFLWVSGIWRTLPPGRQWMPGYWAQSDNGSQWTSGYWADAQASEIQYLPEPPATVEAGPNVAAPSADDNWLPGSWVWQENRYAWRPGSWVAGQQDWQWVPAYYVWTPRGYVFNDGYWDYPVARRGMLFAPVYFSGDAYNQRGFSYSPSTVINPAVFASHLFLRPSYGHYYFGDYYAPSYANAGFSPWFAFQSGGSGYDPFFAQERWQHRQDRDWANDTQENFRNLRDHENARPPHSLAAQIALNTNAAASDNKAVTMAAPLNELSKSKNSTFQLQPVNKAEQQQFGKQGQESRKFVEQRQQLEANAANSAKSPTADSGKPAGPATAKLPKSPYAATNAGQLGKNDAPPKRYEVLKPNLDVVPQPRKAGGDPSLTTGTPKAADKTVPQNQPAKKGDKQSPGDSKGPKPGGQPQAPTGGQPQGGSKGNAPTGTGGQPQGPAGGQQPRTAGGQEPGASPGQQKVNPQNQTPDDSKKDKK